MTLVTAIGDSSRRIPTLRFAIAWLLLAAILALILGSLNLQTLLRLAAHGDRATAIIVQPTCDNHASASYAFNVGATRYSSSDVMSMLDCRSLHPGDSITIYYDTTDPKVSRAIEPEAGIVNEVIPIALACLTAPPIFIAGFIALSRKNRLKGSN
ncbi:MAG: DUF3592 domain-containing protein [Xanthobacteraceae bacterium]